MRAFAAIVILAACSPRSRAHAKAPRDVTNLTDTPVGRIAKCAASVGLSKCLSALAAYRAENALTTIADRRAESSFAKDVKNFPWESYANRTDDDIYSQLCDGTEKLLRYRSMKFNLIPGYEFKLLSNGNGTLNIDVLNGDPNAERSMKKLRKKFYDVVPFLLLPGLIMSAILPFVLPAMKMMTVAVGMINNMALTGAVFTLLRNNAFNDKYDKKVIYVNEGYHNEKHTQVHHDEEHQHHDEEHYQNHKPEHVIDFGDHENHISGLSGAGSNFEFIKDAPITKDDWISQYYGNKFVKVARQDYREHGG